MSDVCTVSIKNALQGLTLVCEPFCPTASDRTTTLCVRSNTCLRYSTMQAKLLNFLEDFT